MSLSTATCNGHKPYTELENILAEALKNNDTKPTERWRKPRTTRRYLQGPLAERLLVMFRPIFDDIADATSFGLGIASLIFCNLAFSEEWISPLVAALIAVFYAGCLFYRLYRFLHPTRKMPPGVFQGMPAPAGAILAGSSVLFATLFHHPAAGVFAAVMVVGTSLLMISNVPYRHFGQVL